MMFNLYPQRSTNPDLLHPKLSFENLSENCFFIHEFFSTYKCDIWAAWGSLIEKRPYLKHCLLAIYETSCNIRNCKWYSVGKLLKNGHLHHPLYLRNDYPLIDFDVANYISTL